MNKEVKYTSTTTVFEAVSKIIQEYAPTIPGLRTELWRFKLEDWMDRASFTLEWERNYGIKASTAIYIHKDENFTEGDTTIQTYEVGLVIGWGSTQRSIPNAVAAIALYTAITNLAAQIQAAVDGFGWIGNVIVTQPAQVPGGERR